uniref:MLL1/MLL complex subunit n=1 Tax=Ascaris suum TaxID=6253 RepID=F1L9X5_ASCSU
MSVTAAFNYPSLRQTMIRQYANSTASTSSATPPNGSAHQDLNSSSTAAKVAEVFLTAGHAFQKLGDLTLQLHSSNGTTTESKWADEDVDHLRDALTRFAHELDNISESIQARTTKLIKTDIKRRTLAADDLTSSVGMPPAKRITTVGQLLAANSANAKRTSVGSVLSVTGTLPTHNVSPRPLNYQPRPRYNPVTVLPTATPSVATTITLQSSPQPIATTRAIALLPSEPNRHYLDPPASTPDISSSNL